MKHYAQQGGRLSPACRVRALQSGQWQRGDGTFVALRAMPDGHLVNALLKHIEDSAHVDALGHYTVAQHVAVTQLLSAEVVRRGLQEYALVEADKRDRRTR